MPNVNKKNWYLEVMWYDYIKFMQILKKCTINFFYRVRILVKDLRILYYKNHICKNRIKIKSYDYVKF